MANGLPPPYPEIYEALNAGQLIPFLGAGAPLYDCNPKRTPWLHKCPQSLGVGEHRSGHARLPGVHIGDAVRRQIQLQDAMQRSFIQDDDVVQTLGANRADQALDKGILPRRSRSREDFANAQPSCRFVDRNRPPHEFRIEKNASWRDYYKSRAAVGRSCVRLSTNTFHLSQFLLCCRQSHIHSNSYARSWRAALRLVRNAGPLKVQWSGNVKWPDHGRDSHRNVVVYGDRMRRQFLPLCRGT
jgi:hypothetical protein